MTGDALNWQDALAAFQRQREETRPVSFDLAGGKVVFRVRMLTQTEKDRVEARAFSSRGRGKGITETEIRSVKTETLKIGIVEGPPGFAPTAANIEQLPAHIRDGLCDAITAWQDLDEDTEADFRGVG